MKILSAKQLGKVDQLSMEIQSISSWELMERASLQAVKAIQPFLKSSQQCIHVFCGVGNNGGDGLAIAYHLAKLNYKIKVYQVTFSDTISTDFEINKKRLQNEQINLKVLSSNAVDVLKIEANEMVIDVIFGVGLNRRMPDFVEAIVREINQSEAFCISIDMPSGMFMHKPLVVDAEWIQPNLCFTFQLLKLPFLLPGTGKYVQQFKIIPIGLSEEAIQLESTQYYYMDLEFIQQIYIPRQRFSHKGTHGHALLVGGQKGMLGSVLLAAKAALKSGVGKLSVLLPALGQTALHSFLPEAMAVENPSEKYIRYTDTTAYDAIGIGVGIGKSVDALAALQGFLVHTQKPVLLDADALNLLAENPDLLKEIPPHSILTPHPGELKRLLGSWNDDFEKLKMIQHFAKQHQCIVVAKEAFTCICDGENFFFNATGNSGMATAGSGDVLSGIITALLAQAYSPLEAAQLGVYVHGLAGDLALSSESKESLIASDIIRFLGKAFQGLGTN